jgi:hypothetical protein
MWCSENWSPWRASPISSWPMPAHESEGAVQARQLGLNAPQAEGGEMA